MNSRFFSQTVLCLLFAMPLFAQGPPLFQAGWGSGFFSDNFGVYPGDPGGSICVSSVANPYPNPKFGNFTNTKTTNCTIGSSLSSSTTFQSKLVDIGHLGFLLESASGANASAVTRGNITATATVSSFSDLGMGEWIPITGTNSNYYQENLPAAVSPGGSLSLKFHIQGSTGSYGCLKVNIYMVSDDPTQEVDFFPDLGIPCSGMSPATVNLPVNTPPLIIGPSGTYSIHIQVSASQNAVGTSTVTVSSNTYVAMGDSYSAGAGDEPYGSGPGDQDCKRSAQGFPIRLNLPLGLIFVACSGSVIDSLYNTAPVPPVQTVDESTSLVTVSIGGNDVDLVLALYDCSLFEAVENVSCQSLLLPVVPQPLTIVQIFNRLLPTVAGRLVTLYKQLQARGPHARILALTYPNPMSSSAAAGRSCPQTFDTLSAPDERFLWQFIEETNAAIRAAASAANIEVVDLNRDANSQFPSHTVCAANSLFFSPKDSGLADIGASYHPNGAGEAEIARIIKAHLDGGPPPSTPFQVGPSQTVTAKLNVAAGQGHAVFSSTWPGSDIVMSLVSPSGHVIDRTTIGPTVDHTVGATFEVYNLTVPEAGTWTVTLFGANVAAQGEQVNLRLTVVPKAPGDADGDGIATCADLTIVKAAFGKRSGQLGFDPRADLNGDGVVDIRDLSAVAQQLFPGTTCQ